MTKNLQTMGSQVVPLKNQLTLPHHVEFVADAEVEASRDVRTPARAFVKELRERPGAWARVPKNLSTSTLRCLKTYGSYFGIAIELRIASAKERWARVLTKAGEHAARMEKRKGIRAPRAHSVLFEEEDEGAVYIDPVYGDDTAPGFGTKERPLKTWAEYRRRLAEKENKT